MVLTVRAIIDPIARRGDPLARAHGCDHPIVYTRQDFVDTNITGTLNLLEESAAAGASRFVLTSTTSAYGRALTPAAGAPAAGCAAG